MTQNKNRKINKTPTAVLLTDFSESLAKEIG